MIGCAHEHELPVILDVKRGDIGSTSAPTLRRLRRRAGVGRAPLAGLGADAVTVSPYLGDDSLEPFIGYCAGGKGVFVLTRTSNPGAAGLQEGECDGRALYLHVPIWSRGWARRTWVSTATATWAPWPARRRRVAARRARGAAARLPARARLRRPGWRRGVSPGRRRRSAGLVVNASRSILYAGEKAVKNTERRRRGGRRDAQRARGLL